MTDNEPTKLESPDRSSGASAPEIKEITAEVTRQVITRVSRFFSGPLPPPEVLLGYNDAFQGAAERIVTMAEGQLKRRQTMESRVVESNCKNERAGLIIGATLTGIAIIGGIYLAATDKPLSGFSVIILNLATLAGVFVYARQAQTKERKEKLKPFKQASGQSPPEQPAN